MTIEGIVISGLLTLGTAVFGVMLEIIRRLIRDKFILVESIQNIHTQKLDNHISDDKDIQEKINVNMEKLLQNDSYILGKFNGHRIQDGKFVKEK